MMRCYCDCSSQNLLIYLDRVLPIATGALLVCMGTLAFFVIHEAGLTFLYPYAAYVLFQVAANWFQIYAYSNFALVSRLQGVDFPNAPFYCDICRCNQPLEVHHCWVCDKCVYRRDHHCFVLGSCIGAHNQAFFIFLMFHLSLGCAIGAYHSTVFYERLFGFYSSGRYEEFFAAVKFYQVYYGHGNSWAALLALFQNITIFFSFSLTNFTIFQTFLVLRGQTQYEFMVGRKSYAPTFRHAWKKIFGPYWYFRLIIPFQSKYVLSMADHLDCKTV